jgi:hypothetical protein
MILKSVGGIANSVPELSLKAQFRPLSTKVIVFPQTFASGSVSSLNYENGRFVPQTF